jgi:membrane protein implicated in regulation of membrane protease activity
MAIAFWAVIVVVSVVVEVHTRAFLAAFIGLAAIVSGIVALAGVPFVIQGIVWVIVTTLGLWLLRPFAVAKFPSHLSGTDMTKPAAVTMTNLRGITESLVGSEAEPGRVLIKGESWKAVTNGDPIVEGVQVVVDKAYGTTLWVKPLP